MRVVSAKSQARSERAAFATGVSSELLMERAGAGIAHFVEQIVQDLELEWEATLLCGKGNNGGDAYVAGQHLLRMGYRVRALQLLLAESELCLREQEAFQREGGEVLSHIEFFEEGVILDGLFGTGFRGEVGEPYKEAIFKANASSAPRFAIDIPSGVNGTTGEVGEVAFLADWTIYLEFPKTGFFLGKGWNYVGKLHRVDLEIPKQFFEETEFLLMEEGDAKKLLPPIVRNRHKYEAGYVVGVAGSEEMPGAAILASEAALRSGAGMVRLLHPEGLKIFHMGIRPEVLTHPFNTVDEILGQLEKATALFIGPGMGRENGFATELLPKIRIPCVIDADALYQIEGVDLPKEAILTPHVGEMSHLLQKKLTGRDLLTATQEYARERGVVIVLKGSPTFVFGSEATIVAKGDPGMATAGCGDVLTGIIASLLAQGVAPEEAAKLGVYLHGEAGELAAQDLTSRALIASDLTDYLSEAFQNLA